ncbi:MAG: mechanosensitive ion channel family protein [Rubricoccaceae bacterium]
MTGFSPAIVEDVLLTVIVLAALLALRGIALRLLYRRTPDVRRRYQWRKWSGYVTAGLALLLLFRIWLGEVGSVATFLGLLSAGVAIALRDPLVNLAGWLFLLWRRPFSPGDRVTIRTFSGDVIDQRVFAFTLLETGTVTGAGQSTGRIIHIPNGWVFVSAVVNHTSAFAYVWHEIAVVVTFESDWRAAKTLLREIANTHAEQLSEDAERRLRRAAQEYMIFYNKLTPTVYTSVVDEGVRLTIRYLVEPRRVRGSEEALWEAVLDAFAARDDIDFAYPTTRIYLNPSEGKPGAGGPPPDGRPRDARNGGLSPPDAIG